MRKLSPLRDIRLMKDKDKELIEQMEALEEVVEWLEQKENSDINEAVETTRVDEDELDAWLKSPKLKKVIKWIDDR